MRRREFIAGLGSAAAWPLTAGAQAYPSRPITMIVPFPPGWWPIIKAANIKAE
jgi:tripartite-type tricarboxylate transporter receptor subunit TctC